VCVHVCRLYLPVLHTYTHTHMRSFYGSCACMCTTDAHAFCMSVLLPFPPKCLPVSCAAPLLTPLAAGSMVAGALVANDASRIFGALGANDASSISIARLRRPEFAIVKYSLFAPTLATGAVGVRLLETRMQTRKAPPKRQNRRQLLCHLTRYVYRKSQLLRQLSGATLARIDPRSWISSCTCAVSLGARAAATAEVLSKCQVCRRSWGAVRGRTKWSGGAVLLILLLLHGECHTRAITANTYCMTDNHTYRHAYLYIMMSISKITSLMYAIITIKHHVKRVMSATCNLTNIYGRILHSATGRIRLAPV